MNKLAFGIAVTAIPLGLGIAVVFGILGSTGGVLTPNVRPDHQTPAVTTFNVEIKTVNGADKMLNVAGQPNGDFVSCVACTLRLVITNHGQNAHNIQVPETRASTGPIAPGESKSIDIVYNKYGTLTYESAGHSDQISGHVMIVKIAG